MPEFYGGLREEAARLAGFLCPVCQPHTVRHHSGWQHSVGGFQAAYTGNRYVRTHLQQMRRNQARI